MRRLPGKRALITGGGALGRASCLRFAEEGARVAVLDVSAKAAEETVALVRERGGEAVPVVADVRDEAAVRAAVGTAVSALGGLDVLFNNAGLMPHQDISFLDGDLDLWRTIGDINLQGTMLCIKYTVPDLIDAGGGAVVNMSSFLAYLGCSIPQDAYAASSPGLLPRLRPRVLDHRLEGGPGRRHLVELPVSPTEPRGDPMCRLLGSVSRTPVTVDDVLGDARDAFLDLARQHGDGWGHAWSRGPGLEVRKAPDSALRSPLLADLAANQAAEAALTHLRWATLHLAVREENTHPFTDGTVAFAHNGSVAPPAALDQLVAPRLAHRRVGDTDSERYFLALLTRMRDREPGAALVDTVEDVVASGADVKSLNCMLLTPRHLYAVCSYDPQSDDDPNYYPLLHRRVADTVVVTSTGWTSDPGWNALANGEMLVVERGTLATSVVPVATPVQVGRAAAG